MNGETRAMRARTASPEEKAALWPEIVAVYKGYDSYQKKAGPGHPGRDLRAAPGLSGGRPSRADAQTGGRCARRRGPDRREGGGTMRPMSMEPAGSPGGRRGRGQAPAQAPGTPPST